MYVYIYIYIGISREIIKIYENTCVWIETNIDKKILHNVELNDKFYFKQNVQH